MARAGDRAAADVDAYVETIDEARREPFRGALSRLRAIVPEGYDEAMTWGFPTFEVPLAISGPTYNGKPLMFAALAAQKRHFGLYLMCAYLSEARKQRLAAAFEAAGKRLDMGKSCIRFRDPDDVPWDAVAREIDLAPANFVAAAAAARAAGGRC
ncbi:DUF1801 domain-containing protein [Sphingomicrobium astaxanthinifaciens]|uniref:DUF1801 domain-containing protein n=1 Tax=Sphingomicrobium astaxanthinifaciens TaxID=1227949 RepID=UPI001FCA7DE3|nr:DUF1801 domain-containing protein [Sphingomicrobium astaxanthinifaciens]MCJ7421511.1 DUF1801 domain-containing protein [Sphingomicrobium astaxanthinifaciens]